MPLGMLSYIRRKPNVLKKMLSWKYCHRKYDKE